MVHPVVLKATFWYFPTREGTRYTTLEPTVKCRSRAIKRAMRFFTKILILDIKMLLEECEFSSGTRAALQVALFRRHLRHIGFGHSTGPNMSHCEIGFAFSPRRQRVGSCEVVNIEPPGWLLTSLRHGASYGACRHG